MKRLLLITILLSVVIISNANAQGWEWAKKAGNGGYDNSNSVTIDGIGNSYIAGSFIDSSITFGSSTLMNAGSYDMFLTKYDTAGNVIWAKRVGGNGYDEAISVSVDASGNVYVTGFFSSKTMLVDTILLTNTDTSGYSKDIFVIKFSSTGNVIWAKSAGGRKSESPSCITTDRFGSVFITGYFNSPAISFDTDTLTNADTSGLTQDIFVVKYNSSGSVNWVKMAGGKRIDYSNSITTDYLGNIIVTGIFNSDSLVFGTDVLTNSTGIDTSDIFIVKYDPLGNVIWAQSTGGNSDDFAFSVATDPHQNIYISGTFSSSSLPFGATTLINTGGSDIFIAKYSSSGTFLWAKSATGISDDNANWIVVDGSNNVWVTGIFFSPSFTIGTTLLTNAGVYTSDIFIAKLDSAGTVTMAICAGGYSSDNASVITCDVWNNVYITGSFNSPTLNFGTDTLTCNLGMNVYLAKYKIGTTLIPLIEHEIQKTTLYPNPTTNIITFKTTQPITNINITNLLGQTVYYNYYKEEEVQVDLSQLPNGIYFVTINGTEVRKFLKQ